MQWTEEDKKSHPAFQPIYSAENPAIILPRPAVPDHLRVYVQHNVIPTKSDLGRVAKRQVEPGTIDQAAYIQGTEEYNIWYGKSPTDSYDFYNRKNREPAQGRCNPFVDSGWTTATVELERDPNLVTPFCLFFAKGLCSYGGDCKYHHRVPTEEDDSKLSPVVDIFGRDRHASHRDDMDGVGSFQMDCRNLFVGELVFDRTDPNYVQTMVNILFKHFSLWGPLENVKVIPNKAIAFLRYKTRAAAEFAKVAMAEQNFGKNGSQICVRWAHPDRNPRAQEEIATRDWNYTKTKVEDRLKQMALPTNTLLKYRNYILKETNGSNNEAKALSAGPYVPPDEGRVKKTVGPASPEDIILNMIDDEEKERTKALQDAQKRMSAILANVSTKDDGNRKGEDDEEFECHI